MNYSNCISFRIDRFMGRNTMDSFREGNNLGRLLQLHSITGRNEIVLYEGKAITVEELHFLKNEFVQNYQIIQHKNASIISKNEIIDAVKSDLVKCRELCYESSNHLRNCHDLIEVMKSKIDLTLNVLETASSKLLNVAENGSVEDTGIDRIKEVAQSLLDHCNVLRSYNQSEDNATIGDRLFEQLGDVDAVERLQEQTGFGGGDNNLSQDAVFETD